MSLDGGIIINCPFLPVPLVGVGKLIIGSVFHTWMLKRARAAVIERRQASLAYRCDKAQVVSRLQTKVDWLDTNK